MDTLELKPLGKKKLNVLIVEKEYNEPFRLTEQTANPLNALFNPSIGFNSFLETVITKVKVDYVAEEIGLRSQKQFAENNSTANVFRKAKIPYFPVDIEENARNYLTAALDQKVALRNSVLKNLDAMSKQNTKDESSQKEYLIAYGQGLQAEIEEKEAEVNFSVRESWMAMGILNHARENSKDEINCLFICSPSHVAGIKQLLGSLNVKVESAKVTKKVISSAAEVPSVPELENWLQSIQVQVKPVIGKGGENPPYLLFYLDTDSKASPFDICMAYDAGYNAVIPYENMTAEDSKTIALDALLSRGPKGAKNTVFMIGGKNAERAEEVFKAIKGVMFPPFVGNIIIDPAGAYTTAAAMVAKAETSLVEKKLGELKDKTCAIMGTGAVGQIAAVLLAKMGCKVMIASLNPKRTDGKEHIEGIAKLLAAEHGVQVQGIFAPTDASKIEIIKKADVVMCAGIRGVQIITKEMMNEVKHMKVLLDINAVPPLGVEGIELKDDMREMMPGIFTIGALAVGELKHKLEKEILREARGPGKDVYNYNVDLPLARKLLEKDLLPSKMVVTVNYPASKLSK